MEETNKPRECHCDRCVAACKRKPGWFAPGEAEKAAEYLGMTLKEFFDKYLFVDYWSAADNVYLLSPAILGAETGEVAPFSTRGQCVFLNKDDRCSIHPVKPYECRYAMLCEEVKSTGISHEELAYLWDTDESKNQIYELLGRPPSEPEDDPDISDIFNILL